MAGVDSTLHEQSFHFANCAFLNLYFKHYSLELLANKPYWYN